jgi:co-chaperonin GroES (HSP10)
MKKPTRRALTANSLEMLQDNVLVKLDPPAQRDGNILLSDSGKEKRSRSGLVIAIGPGRRHKKTGRLIPNSMEVKPGDRVRMSYFAEKYGGDLEIDGSLHIITTNDDIYCVEEPNQTKETK